MRSLQVGVEIGLRTPGLHRDEGGGVGRGCEELVGAASVLGPGGLDESAQRLFYPLLRACPGRYHGYNLQVSHREPLSRSSIRQYRIQPTSAVRPAGSLQPWPRNAARPIRARLPGNATSLLREFAP